MDPFLNGLLNSFSTKFELDELGEAALFERFVNYATAFQYYPDEFNLEDASPGGAQDIGLDGVMIIVNGRLITEKAALRDLLALLSKVEVTFVVTQAKTSPHFRAADAGTFLSGVESFFAANAQLPENSEIADLRSVKEAVYENAASIRGRPDLNIYYATTGIWRDDATFQGRVDQHLDRLRETHMFGNVEFRTLDHDGVVTLYQRALHHSVAEVSFASHVGMPDLAGVVQGYVGLIPAREYLKLVVDESGRVRRRVFSDNVRDFQGVNRVNTEIHSTIRDQDQQPWFPLLNNGVTIVARKIKRTASKFILENYQIVNGCQTSWILWANAAQIAEGTVIPIRLVETTDTDLTNLIIRATNSQTEIKVEAFESLKPFHKKLEQLYDSQLRSAPVQLRYERRCMQYHWDSDVRPQDVVTLGLQLNSFLAVWLEEPHSTHRYYGELLEAYSNRLFQQEHDPLEYYVAAIAMRHANGWLRSGRGERNHRRFKYHLALILRALAGPAGEHRKPKDRARYVAAVHAQLVGENTSHLLEQATRILEAGIRNGPSMSHADLSRKREFTRLLLKTVEDSVGGPVTLVREGEGKTAQTVKSARKRRRRRKRR